MRKLKAELFGIWQHESKVSVLMTSRHAHMGVLHSPYSPR